MSCTCYGAFGTFTVALDTSDTPTLSTMAVHVATFVVVMPGTALKTNPKSAVAAYNLSVIIAKENIEEAIEWCRKARDLRPDEPKYGYTLAFYLRQDGDVDGAVLTLEQLVRQQVAYPDAYAMLGQIYEERGKIDEAIEV